jgi:phenylpropionate dioxygenase-like ring-hydroxylating dioxygenase large terminal subunit/DNA-binding transcriptional regulator YbjK
MSQAEPDFSIQNERRRLLVEATMSAISEHGFSNLTLAKIAGLAGLTAGAVNFHFDSKEALLLATLQRVADDFAASLNTALAGADPNPADRLRAVIDVSLDASVSEFRRVAVWYAFISEASARDDYQSICGERDRDYFNVIHTQCAALITAAQKDNAINARAIAQALTGLVDELWQEILFAGENYDRAAAKDQCLAFLASVFPWCFDMPQRAASPIPTPQRRQDAYSLPAWIYDNAEFFELEKDHVFADAWQIVCHACDIPNAGDYHTLDLLKERVFVMRGNDGEVRAFHNVCRHRASRLLDGTSGHCPGRIVCPYHAWAYETSGELKWVPFEDEYENLDRSQHHLAPVACEVFLGFVFIRLAPEGPSVAQTLAPVADELRLYRTEDLQPLIPMTNQTVDVNWKNGTDNYVDALHVRAAHPGLNSLLNKTYTLEYRGDGVHRLHGKVEHVTGQSELAMRYQQCLPDVDFLPESHKRTWLYYMVWPNLAFNLYPDQVEFMQFTPIGPTSTQIRFGTYAIDDDREAMTQAREVNLRLNEDVGSEDTDLIARVQAGMASRSYVRGPLGKNEICLRAFAERMRSTLPVCLETEAPPTGQVAVRNAELREPRQNQ